MKRLNEVIEGDFDNDKVEGVAHVKYGNGNTYEGSWKNNKKHGKGRYEFKERQEVHEGEWVDDSKEGEFVETRNKDGYILKGNYIKNEKNGEFVFNDISTGEEKRRETWKNGVLAYK